MMTYSIPTTSITPGDVHVWTVSIDATKFALGPYKAMLSDDERQRADRLIFARDRHAFIIAHGALREIIGHYVNTTPKQLSFDYSRFGKPQLPEKIDGHSLSFNLSHSGNMAVIAIMLDDEIGVDIEHIREGISCLDIAKRFFSRNEAEQLLSLPAEQRTLAFFNGWTRKEAFIKAVGAGLSFPLSAFDVTITPKEAASLQRLTGHHTSASDWDMRALTLPPGYVGAVVKKGRISSLRLRDWN